jgi:hypothetical protein
MSRFYKPYEDTDYVSRLTRSEGTWLAVPPDEVEDKRLNRAASLLRDQRAIALEFHRDGEAVKAFSIELFRGEAFAPLVFSNQLVEKMIAAVGEPPVVDESESDQFSAYLQQAVLAIATPTVRRGLARQLRRMLPQFVEAGQWKEAVAIDYNAFRTSLGNEVSPFLAQMALAGLAAYYDEHEAEGMDDAI